MIQEKKNDETKQNKKRTNERTTNKKANHKTRGNCYRVAVNLISLILSENVNQLLEINTHSEFIQLFLMPVNKQNKI